MWMTIVGKWKNMNFKERVEALKQCDEIEMFSFRLAIQKAVAERTRTPIRKIKDISNDEITPEDFQITKKEFDELYEKAAKSSQINLINVVSNTLLEWGKHETIKIIFVVFWFISQKRNINSEDQDTIKWLYDFYTDPMRPSPEEWKLLQQAMPESVIEIVEMQKMLNQEKFLHFE